MTVEPDPCPSRQFNRFLWAKSSIFSEIKIKIKKLFFLVPAPLNQIMGYHEHGWFLIFIITMYVKHYETPYQYMYIVALGCHSLHENAHVNFSDQMTREMTASKKLF